MLVKKNIIIFSAIVIGMSFLVQADAANKNCQTYKAQNYDGSYAKANGEILTACLPKNYVNYTTKQAANDFLLDMVLIKRGSFHPANNSKYSETLKTFYIDKYMIPYQQYNAYLKATHQWHYGNVPPSGTSGIFNKNNYMRMSEKYNGLYPAQVSYDNAKGFCEWMGKQTGLPVTLASYPQWIYAATSRGTNWQYPTNNGKLEVGVNYPDYPSMNTKEVQQPVNNNPVNSLGLYQMFGNGLQWTSTVLNNKNANEYNISWAAKIGSQITPGTSLLFDKATFEKITLSSSFALGNMASAKGGLSFRCVINTDKPLSNK